MFAALPVLALAGLAAAQQTPVGPIVTPPANNGTAVTTVTRVVDVYTTVCPEPTTFTYNGKGYTVTAPTTLTITDCPCTITETKPVVPGPTGGAAKPPAPPAGEKPSPPSENGPPAEEQPPVSGASQAQAGVVALAGLFAAAVFAL